MASSDGVGISVYGKPENYGGDTFQEGDDGWRSGKCWVFDGYEWQKASAVYVRAGNAWKSAKELG